MILVDSSVWIDYFRGVRSPQTEHLDALLADADDELGAADLVVFEVLRGFTSPKAHRQAKELLLSTRIVALGGLDNALAAAHHYRTLREVGYTIASPIDVLLASYCITNNHTLLHSDADFDVIETMRGLKTWPH